jgi:glycine/D-amino acid oxidase-like deaminating enzyme
VCWNIDTEVYFRPHGQLVLACPGDDTRHDAALPATDPNQVNALMQALREQAPALGNARVVRSWACLRTRSADGSMAIGPDPSRLGLHWLAGLGGHGMTVGLAAGELLARQLHGQPDPLVETFAVTRFAT